MYPTFTYSLYSIVLLATLDYRAQDAIFSSRGLMVKKSMVRLVKCARSFLQNDVKRQSSKKVSDIVTKSKFTTVAQASSGQNLLQLLHNVECFLQVGFNVLARLRLELARAHRHGFQRGKNLLLVDVMHNAVHGRLHVLLKRLWSNAFLLARQLVLWHGIPGKKLDEPVVE